MSVKKEASGRRSVRVEVEVPGTPEEVWQAIATGPGISSWLMPTEFEERDGKPVAVKFTFGPDMEPRCEVTAWDPPRMFATTADGLSPGSPPMASEWTVEARTGGKCMVRVVHSLFASTDDWDNQLDGLEKGWPAIFRILRRYLESFKGMACSAMQFISFSSDTASNVVVSASRARNFVSRPFASGGFLRRFSTTFSSYARSASATKKSR